MKDASSGAQQDTSEGVSILHVEDDPSLREAIAELLEAEGYAVTSVGSAEAGLQRLRERRFDLVLSDFMLPGETGGWMLREARAQGLLEQTPFLMLTSLVRPEVPAGTRVLHKPFDIGDLLQAVADLLTSARARSLASRGATAPASAPVNQARLVLYITGATPASHRALRRLERVLAHYAREQVALTIVDVTRQPEPPGLPPTIPFTPALLRVQPAPQLWVLGDLRDEEPVITLLESANVERVS